MTLVFRCERWARLFSPVRTHNDRREKEMRKHKNPQIIQITPSVHHPSFTVWYSILVVDPSLHTRVHEGVTGLKNLMLQNQT
jgi:hypothetical protein